MSCWGGLSSVSVPAERVNLPCELFRHCPRCGSAVQPPAPNKPVHCAACGLELFLNPAVAVGAFVRRPDQRLLWLRRAKDPGRGKLGLAGGFLDLWETAEEALARELREETGLQPLSWRFLCSAPNPYDFAGVRYPVCDLFFEVHVAAAGAIQAQEAEVAAGNGSLKNKSIPRTSPSRRSAAPLPCCRSSRLRQGSQVEEARGHTSATALLIDAASIR